MKYNPHLRSGTHHRRRLLVATTCAAAVLLYDMVSGGSVHTRLRNTAALLYDAAHRAEASALIASVESSDTAQLVAENQSLRREIEQYRARVYAAEAMRQENLRLAALVHLAERRDGVTAPVVSSVQSSPYGTFLVGAGAQHGIRVNDIVFSDDGFVVGRVRDVQEQLSLVELILAPLASQDVVLDQAPLTLEGRGGGNGEIKAPRALAVAIGDIVFAPALGNMPVGAVGKVESNPASPYKTVFVRVPQNLASMRFVYITPP